MTKNSSMPSRTKMLRGVRLSALAVLTVAMTGPAPSEACTVVALPGSDIVAKSYDWHFDHGLFVVNPRGLSKTALDLTGAGNPARWTARYGSLTINQYGREFPVSGMNEAGLIVEVAVGPASHSPTDKRPFVNELQWVQYQLDNFGTVVEVLEHLEELRIAPVQARLHYFIADRQGDRAVVEFVKGQAVSHSTLAGDLEIAAITNSSYSRSVDFAGRHRGFGGDQPVPSGTPSLNRFVRVAAEAARGSATVDGAFEALSSVRFDRGYTKWNIVYEGEQVHFASSTQDFSRKTIDLARLDFSCERSAMIQDVTLDVFGDVTGHFHAYAPEPNQQQLLRAGFAGPVLFRIATYPESTSCVL